MFYIYIYIVCIIYICYRQLQFMSKFAIMQPYSRRRCILPDASAKIGELLDHLRGTSYAKYTVM